VSWPTRIPQDTSYKHYHLLSKIVMLQNKAPKDDMLNYYIHIWVVRKWQQCSRTMESHMCYHKLSFAKSSKKGVCYHCFTPTVKFRTIYYTKIKRELFRRKDHSPWIVVLREQETPSLVTPFLDDSPKTCHPGSYPSVLCMCSLADFAAVII
jgi:hypothetical protein